MEEKKKIMFQEALTAFIMDWRLRNDIGDLDFEGEVRKGYVSVKVKEKSVKGK